MLQEQTAPKLTRQRFGLFFLTQAKSTTGHHDFLEQPSSKQGPSKAGCFNLSLTQDLPLTLSLTQDLPHLPQQEKRNPPPISVEIGNVPPVC